MEKNIKMLIAKNNNVNKPINKKIDYTIKENEITASNNQLCILIFAFNRYDYLERVLKAITKAENIENWHIIYIQDGPTCKLTKNIAEKYLPKIKCKSIKKFYFEMNKNIALSQHFGLIQALIIEKYKYVLHLEDDLVISPSYLKTIEALLDFTENNNSIAYVSGSHINNGKSDKLLTSPIGLIHSWGIGISRSKFLLIEPTYSKAIEALYKDYDYKTIKLHKDRIIDIRVNMLGLEHSKDYTQDSTINLCWKKFGFNHILHPEKRHSLPIGVIGEHFTEKIFERNLLDNKTNDYIHPAIIPNYI